MQAIDAALAVQAPGQRLVVEHRTEPGMQAEQRLGLGDRAVEQQQRVQAQGLLAVTGQLTDGWLGHHVAQFQFDTQVRLGAHFGQHLEDAQGIATELEEVVGHANTVDLQHLLPDGRQAALQFVAWGDELLPLEVRIRQGLAVQFAVGVKREGCQHEDLCRHHVVRQLGLQFCTQAFAQATFVSGDHITDQLLATAAFTGDDHGILYRRQVAQARFDFTQFDAETTDLHLVVQAPEVIDDPIGTLAHQVAGTVKATAVAGEWVGDETLGGQAPALMVATGNAFTADVQLTGDAIRYRVELFIKHIQGPCADASADWSVDCAAFLVCRDFPQ
ncbi:hypothetical protein D9M71_252480 [compost metagenome]